MADIQVPINALEIFIRDPNRLLFEGLAQSVTSTNTKGVFDILPIHENFICIIKEKVTVRTKDGPKDYPLQKGILKVEENVVHIFLGAESL